MRGGQVLRRRAARVASAVLLAAVGAGVVLPPNAQAQTPGATATATPSTNLTDASDITVTGSGFTPNATLFIVQCGSRYPGGVEPSSHCQIDLFLGTRADANGNLVPRTFNPDPVLYLREPVYVDGVLTYEPYVEDCRVTDGCKLIVGEGLETKATVPLHYAPDGPLAGDVTVTPTAGLVDAQVLTIMGSGLNGMRVLTARQCIDDPGRGALCEPRRSNNRQVQGDGTTAPLPYRVDAVISSEQQPGFRGHDCRTASRCFLRVEFKDDPTEPVFDFPLAFDPAAPLTPPPSVTVTPNRDLVHLEQVTIQGEDRAIGEPLEMRLCGPDSNWYDACTSVGPAYTNLDGTFTAMPRLPVGFATSSGNVDCRTTPQPCQLLVSPNALSSRLTRVDVHFDPEGPDPVDPNAPPVITLTPAADLDHLESVQIDVKGFAPNTPFVRAELCPLNAGTQADCTPLAGGQSDRAGKVTFILEVPAEFEKATPGDIADCRVEPGCHIVVTGGEKRAESSPLAFEPTPPRRRYVDRVFDRTQATTAIPYRTTTNWVGGPVTLLADVYEPAGDTAARRPVVVWLDETYFSFNLRSFGFLAGAPTARDYARRGYVVVVLDTRVRSSVTSFPQRTREFDAAANDAYDDATAGLAWLRSHAAYYRIDPDAIAVSGLGAGGITAFNLAYMPGQRGPATSQVAAALPVSAFNMGTPEAGEPPVLAFHSTGDEYIPASTPQSDCDAATAAGLRCDVVTVDHVNHQLRPDGPNPFFGRQEERVQTGAEFLADVMLDFGVEADAGGPYSVVEGSRVTLDGSSSSGDGLSYTWAPATRVDDPTSATPTLPGIDDGTETLTLTVTDEHGINDTDTVEVTTSNAPPAIPVLNLRATPPDQTVNVQVGITDPGIDDTHTAVADWGDGTSEPLPVRAGQSAGAHTYTEPGRYTVTVTATDDDGGTVTARRQVVVGCTIVGTDRNDLLVGTRGDDVICGLGGHDLVAGLDGHDRIYGGTGNDFLLGGRGNDRLGGGPGFDAAIGEQGTNTCTAELRRSCSRRN